MCVLLVAFVCVCVLNVQTCLFQSALVLDVVAPFLPSSSRFLPSRCRSPTTKRSSASANPTRQLHAATKAFKDDADQQRPRQQQALPHQRHAPLHRSRQQHGRDHHGAEPAARRAAGGAGGQRGGGEQQQQRAAVPQQAEGHVRALPAAQVHQERHGVGPAEEGDEQRGQLPGDGGEAGGAAAAGHRGAAPGRQLGPGAPVSLSPQGTVRSSVQAHAASRPPHQQIQEGNRRWKLHEIEVTTFGSSTHTHTHTPPPPSDCLTCTVGCVEKGSTSS